MEAQFRRDLVEWLRGDRTLELRINAFEEESPLEAHPPYAGIVASAAIDSSCKSHAGREVRIAIEAVERHEATTRLTDTIAVIERRIAALPSERAGYRIVAVQFLRSRVERRARHLRAGLIEYRFRLIETPLEIRR